MKRKISRGSYVRLALLAVSALIITATLVTGKMLSENKKYNENAEAESNKFGIADLGDKTEGSIKDNVEGVLDETESDKQGAETPVVTAEQSSEDETVESSGTAEVSEVIAAATGNIDFSKLVWPVTSTKTVMDYSYNAEPVFSPTFNEYRSDHTGIDISAQKGEEVKSVYDGTVTEIYDDEKLGTTIRVDHGNNIISEYANLDRNVSVTLNQKVKSGATIAKVGDTAKYELAEEPHLHFALILNGKYVDINDYLNK